MQAVLARAEIDRPDWNALHHCAHLIERQAIDADGIAITERTRKIAFIGQPEAKCKLRWQVWLGFRGALSGR